MASQKIEKPVGSQSGKKEPAKAPGSKQAGAAKGEQKREPRKKASGGKGGAKK